MITFEVRQLVKSVHKSWLEVVCSNELERPVRVEYDRLVGEYPNEYFELVRVERNEDCLAFTPKFD